MAVQNVSGRRGGVIAWAAALVLLVLVAGFDNQWIANWRVERMGDGWLATPVHSLSAFEWRATPLSGQPTRAFAAGLAAAVLTVLLTGLLGMLVCRGVGSERGRWALFFGIWLATGLAASLSLIAGVLIAGDKTVKLNTGATYSTLLDLGVQFGLYAGWLIAFAAVLAYGSTPGMDLVPDAEYDMPADYEYGPGLPATSYSYSPTSPYSQNSGYGDYGGYTGEETTQVNQTHDPYGGQQY